MKKEEKLDYILYQLWLVLDLKDYVRTMIILKKIQKWNLNDKGVEHLKVRYYELSIWYYIHEKDHLETAKSFQTIYDTIHENSDKACFSADQMHNSF
mgnify:CR=1 FL=1